MLRMEPIEIALLEERRQACGVADIATDSAPISGGMMCFEGPGSWVNQATGLGLDGPVSGADLDRVVAWYTERGVPAVVEVAAPAHGSLVTGLADRGFVTRYFENVYAITPETRGSDGQPSQEMRGAEVDASANRLPDGLRWAEVDPADDEDVRAYAEVTTSGFEPRLQDDGSVLPLSEAELGLMTRVVRHPRHTCLAVEAEGASGGDEGCGFVAVAGMEITEIPPSPMTAGGVTACLFGAVTVPEWRRLGVQRAMIARRVDIAIAAGARAVIVQTKPGIPTERNARRLGFELAYTRAVMHRPLGA